MKRLLILIELILNASLITSDHCPPDEVMTPCACGDNIIFCGGSNQLDLQSIFQLLSNNLNDSEKHFNEFYLNNNAITSLDENVFLDISFDVITIENAFSLNKIHTNAFGHNSEHIKELYITDSPVKNISPDYDIFKAVNRMTNLEELVLKRTNITELPAHAFHSTPDNPNSLSYIEIVGSLRTIADKAFVGLENVRAISLDDNHINFIPENAFVLNANRNTVEISFLQNRLNATSFALGAFSHINRSLALFLQFNELKYLDRKIFEPILEKGNKLFVGGNAFICDCRMYWVYAKRDNYMPLIWSAICPNFEKVESLEEFPSVWDSYEMRRNVINEQTCGKV